MTNYSNKINNNNNNHHIDNDNPPTSSCCFSGFFRRFNCTGNLPTHPFPSADAHLSLLEKPINNHSFSRQISVKSQLQSHQVHPNHSPGIIARLMGLDSLPKHDNNVTTLDSLFRSKSLNSMHFLPDFDPTRASFHRRARTSASFHEQENSFLVKIDENIQISDGLILEETGVDYECRKQKKKKKENEVGLKEKISQNFSRIKETKSKNKFEECYYTSGTRNCSRRSSRSLKNSVAANNGSINSNFGEKLRIQKGKLVNNNTKEKNGKVVYCSTVSSKKKVDHKQEVQSDDALQSRSPVSVLSHHHTEFVPICKGDRRPNHSKSRRKSSPKIKFKESNDNLPQVIGPKSKQKNEDCCDTIASKHDVVKAEMELAEYFVEMLGQVSKLAEEHTRDDSKYEFFKLNFVEDFSKDLAQHMLDLLLHELLLETVGVYHCDLGT